MNVILAAAALAREAHAGQSRKYTGLPYVQHPARVAGLVALREDATEEMVAAAFLHDVLEDTAVTDAEVSARTDQRVAALVRWLTNPSKGVHAPRAERKRMDREHLAKAPREAKIIKMLDRIDNLREMGGAPDGFKRLYAEESLLLAGAVGDADPALAETLVRAAGDIKPYI